METIFDHNPTRKELEELGLDDDGVISRLSAEGMVTRIAWLYDMRGDAGMYERYKNMLSEEEQSHRFPPEDCLYH